MHSICSLLICKTANVRQGTMRKALGQSVLSPIRAAQIVLLAAALFPAATVMSACGRRVVSVQEVDRMVRAQTPIGSDREKVDSFIADLKVDSLKITRASLQKAEPPILDYARTPSDRAKLEELDGRIAELGSVAIVGKRGYRRCRDELT